MKRLVFFLVAACCAIGIATASAQEPLTILTEKLPPFNFERDGEVRGISADLLLLALDRTGNPTPRSAIRVFPWARAYLMVQREPGTVLFSMARTEEREPLFRWVGPIQELTIGLIARKERGIVLNSMADAEAYTIGTIRDGAPEQLVIAAGVNPDRLDRLTDPSLNLKKLEAGRIDLFAFNVPTTFFMMRQAGMDPAGYEVVHTLKRTALYYAFHKDTPDDLIERLNSAVAELKAPVASGRSAMDEIVEKYLGPVTRH